MLELISTGLNCKIVVLKKTTLQFYFKTSIQRDYLVELISTGWNDKIVVLKKKKLQLNLKPFIEKINSANMIM